jgi:hypothetical protein
MLESETELRKASALPLLQVRFGDVMRCASYILTSPDHFSPARMEFDYSTPTFFANRGCFQRRFVVRRSSLPRTCIPALTPVFQSRYSSSGTGNPIAHLDSRF